MSDSFADCKNHFLAVLALVVVSAVVKVLEAMRKRVVSGSEALRASVTMTGPRSEPPIPMLTMVVSFLPVYPFHSPLRTCSENSFMCWRTSLTPPGQFVTSWPSTFISHPPVLRRAGWKTARFSVKLILSPRKRASRLRSTPACSASLTRRSRVSSLIKFLEKSNRISAERSFPGAKVRVKRLKRSRSEEKASLRTKFLLTPSRCDWSSDQAGRVLAGAILTKG